MFRCNIFICLVLFVAVFEVNGAAVDKDKEAKILKECQEKNKVSDNDVEKFHKGSEMPDDSPEVRCFVKCSLEMFGAMNDDGTINKDNSGEYIKKTFGENAEKANELWLDCQEKAEKGDDLCKFSYTLVQCFIDELKKENIHAIDD